MILFGSIRHQARGGKLLWHWRRGIMKGRITLVSLAIAAALVSAAATPDSTEHLFGYSDAAASRELEWEAKFKAIPLPENIKEYNRRLSARPHHVGSPYDKDNAEWILSKF